MYFSILLPFLCCFAFPNFGLAFNFPFRNVSLPWSERVNDLVHRLSLREMVQQMTFGGGGRPLPCPAIPRLGIKPYNFDTECLRGVMSNPSTAFPQSIGLAATFSPALLFRISEVIATEARAIYNNASEHGIYKNQKSISCLAPFINIMRHPLWGRVQEIYGEDPYLSGLLAASYVKGLQGNHSRYLRANAGCKVVDVHSGPENIPVSRFSFNSVVSQRDFRLTYLPNFKMCIEAGSYNLMCSYNSINGVPACANKMLLTDILRNEFGFDGYYISDEGAIERIYLSHKYVNSTLEAAAVAVNAGVNLELTPGGQPSFSFLTEAVKKGLVSYKTIVERVKPLFLTRMRLGEFDPPEMNPYSKIKLDVIQSAAHRDLAVEAAMKSFVLLKNTNGVLPFRKRFSKLAIVGPMGNNIKELYGDYSPIPVLQYASTPFTGLQRLANHVTMASGCTDNKCRKYNATEVASATAGAEAVIVCLGTGISIESEGNDRANMELPGKQLILLKDTVRFAAGVPVILLIFSAGPLDIRYAVSSSGIMAILQCWFPAQATGEALYRMLSAVEGHVFSPAGRLPYTWPESMSQVPPIVNYSMEGRTYRYFKGKPLFPFGYGLSYSTFSYSDLEVPACIKAGDDITVKVTITNHGPHLADEVVQVYISWINCTVLMPQLQLAATKRLTIPVRASKKVVLSVTADQMKIWHDSKGFIYHIGKMSLWAGGQQPNQEKTVGSNVLHKHYTITK